MEPSVPRALDLPESGPPLWSVPADSVAFDEPEITSRLLELRRPCYMICHGDRVGVSHEGQWAGSARSTAAHFRTSTWVPPIPVDALGDPAFRVTHGVRYAYYTGAMANGIASEDLVIALGRAGFLGSFGAAGLLLPRIEAAIARIQAALPRGPYAFNLIHSPNEPALESGAVDLYLAHGVQCVEASAFLDLTPSVVRYRATGLSLDPQNHIQVGHRVIAKVSRREVARKFLEPAPSRIVSYLRDQNLITEEQARLSQHVPMADDVTVEADSGGHTDNRPMFAALPSILALRDEVQARQAYDRRVRVGAGGGIGTPDAALATFMMGAGYVVTGSINQCCVEAAVSRRAKQLLAQADVADVAMAPAADMFEMGIRLQVLKRGTLFAMRARKLYDLYTRHNSLEEIPREERETLEKQVFKSSLDAIWKSTVAYFAERNPALIERAATDPKKAMALVFRWYLGLSSRWSIAGDPGREMDYQIWCGPAMGTFNAWAANSYLADIDNRSVVDVARHILTGAAFLYRLHHLALQGVHLPPQCRVYRPEPFPP